MKFDWIGPMGILDSAPSGIYVKIWTTIIALSFSIVCLIITSTIPPVGSTLTW